MQMYRFHYNCVYPVSLEELEVIVDDLTDNISYDKFTEAVPFEDINEILGGIYPEEEVLRKDWHVRFFIGQVTFEEEVINYAVIVHSAIEYVWKLE